MTQKSGDVSHLANQFLIAMPGMVDDNFAGAVVYLCDHTSSGAMGLVINRPTDVDLATVFEKVDLKLEIQAKAAEPVYFGGPVQTDRGFVLHEQKQGEHTTHYNSSLRIPGGLAMTTSKDVLEEIDKKFLESINLKSEPCPAAITDAKVNLAL
jgi:putative transcriptional regulator